MPVVTEQTKVIATTILQQIGGETLACIGMPRKSVVIIPETLDDPPVFGVENHLGGVQFNFTNCPKVKSGTVKITLSGNDTYRVVILNKGKQIIYDEKDIYCDALGGRNGVIERVTG